MKYKIKIDNSFEVNKISFDFGKENEILTMFFYDDLRQFYKIIVEGLDAVLKKETQSYDSSFNATDLVVTATKTIITDLFSEDREFATCEIPTQELLDLVKEWKHLNDELKRGI